MKVFKKYKIVFNSPVTLTFIGICFVVTLLGWITKGYTTKLLFMTYHSSLLNPLTYLRFFTHVVGHSGWGHFFNNAMYILLLGPMLEDRYKPRVMIEVICVTAVVTALFNYIFFPNVGLCGASGVVFAFILLSSFTGFRRNEIPLTLVLVAVLYLGEQFVDGITIRDNISNSSHIIGGLVGMTIGYVMNRK